MSRTHQTNKDGLFNFIGTLSKKKEKKIKELEDLEFEGRSAIDSATSKPSIDDLPEDYILNELEERRMIDPCMQRDEGYQLLKQTLINWINDELSEFRIIVFQLEDLYDGSVLGKLVEKLSKKQLNLIEVTLNEELQKSKLTEVLNTIETLLDPIHSNRQTWTVEGIHSKDLVQIIQLLIALIRQFNVPIRLPENVNVKIVIIQKLNGILVPRIVSEPLTGKYDDSGVLGSTKDAFDTIYEKSPELLNELNYRLISFLNEQLTKLNIECQVQNEFDIDTVQFSDGLLLIFLMGLCEDFFVPLGNIYMTPNNVPANFEANNDSKDETICLNNFTNTTSRHKLHNMNVAFQLMEDAGIQIRKMVRPEEIINCDRKSLLKVLYMIYTKYQSNLDFN